MLDAFRPIILLIPGGGALSGVLRPGQVLQGVIAEHEGAFFLMVRGQRIPVEVHPALAAGQRAAVEVGEQAGGLALRVSLQPPPPSSGAVSAGDALRQAIFDALKALGAAARSNTAAQIPPAWFPANAAAVRQLVSLFLLRDTLGPDIRQIAQWVQQAVNAGALPAQSLESVLWLLGGAEGSEMAARLRDLVRARSAEALLASFAAGEDAENILDALERDVRTVLKRLIDDDAFRGFLRGQGKWRTFQQTAQRTLDRLDGASAQNLRGLEHPYAFLELPMPPEAPVRHAQIHFFAPRHGQGTAHALVALDLETIRLGSLWVTLHAAPGRCDCHFRVTGQHAADIIGAATEELAAALREAGYQNPQVAVSLWDGDRLAATAELLGRFEGVDVCA